ncbi:unnamed protein product [Adineta steineri]|uniref:Uncharacterized protein n=1 Tax=Adineta steineri TaxID=433720 RepID=A0A815B7Y9_9BILA|nr:unnamed protein product [Adineta steineri]CAF3617592.1 unnamed protein product [Adineta steineri]
MSFITKKLEKALGVDLNGDGVIGSNRNRSRGGGGIVNKIEKVAGVDLNGDGYIGGGGGRGMNRGPGRGHLQNRRGRGGGRHPVLQNYGQQGGPNYSPQFNQYGGSGYGPNPQLSNNDILVDRLEKATGHDLNGDGRIGVVGPGSPHNQYGPPPPYSMNNNQYGGSYNYQPNFNQNGGPRYGSNPYRPNNDMMVDQLERATGVDLNGDGRIGGHGRQFNRNY